MVQTNFFLASNVVYYVDVDDLQKQVNVMLVNLVQWFGPLLIWLIFYCLITMKNNLNTNTVSEIPLQRPNGKKLETSKLKLNKSIRELSRRIRPVQCRSSLARSNGKKLEPSNLKLNKSVRELSRRMRPMECWSSLWFQCLVIFALVLMPVKSSPCSVTNGLVANEVDCTCGNEECTTSRGLICYSTIGGGSCRKNDVGAFGYPRPESGNCDDVAGRKSILDKAGCDAAAVSLDLSDVVANEVSYSHYPPGCFWRSDNRLYYNTLTTSTTSCSSSYICLCLSAPNCLETDGTTSNTGPCFCGSTGCTIASGFYCTSTTSTCSSGNMCTNIDGSSINTIACSCGTTSCNFFKGMYCYLPENKCQQTPDSLWVDACINNTGISTNSNACTCGNVVCTSPVRFFK